MEYSFHDEIDSVAPVLAPCGVTSIMNIQSDLGISNLRNQNGMGYISGDPESVSAETHSMPIISDPVLSQVDTPFDLVRIYFENCSMVFDAKFLNRPSNSSGQSVQAKHVGLIKLSLRSMRKVEKSD